MKLHIGGKTVAKGWSILDIAPGPHVDHVGDCSNLSTFVDDSFEAVYASHVLEHLDYTGQLQATIKDIFRILMPGGVFMFSVPDMEVISHMFLTPQITTDDRTQLMMYLFGGHVDQHDYHQTGLFWQLIEPMLLECKFVNIQRVEGFGLFDDCSTYRFRGQLISLNVKAEKPA